MVSDFLDDADCLRPLQYLADFGHELLLVQLWGDRDRALDTGDVSLIDQRWGSHLKISVDASAREQYTASFDAYADQIRHLALRNGGRYSGLATTTGIEEAMFGRLMNLEGTLSFQMFFLNLSAAEFLALLGTLSGLVTAFYLFDRTKRKRVVSTLRFWASAGAAEDQPRRKKVNQPWSLLIG